jgi:hypothetical protein
VHGSQRLDKLVLPLARHQPAEADDELAAHAQTIARRRSPLRARRRERSTVDRRPQHLGGDRACDTPCRQRGELAHGDQQRGVAQHATQQVAGDRQGGRQGDLRSAQEHQIRPPRALAQCGAEQPGGQRVTELHQANVVACDELLGLPAQCSGGPKDAVRRTNHGVVVRGVESGRGGMRRRENDHLVGVERLDHPPVIRLGAPDAWRKIVGDEQ